MGHSAALSLSTSPPHADLGVAHPLHNTHSVLIALVKSEYHAPNIHE